MEPKNKGGRPRKKPSEKFSRPVQAFFREAELKRLSNGTGKLSMSSANFMRSASLLVLDGIEKGEIDLGKLLVIASENK